MYNPTPLQHELLHLLHTYGPGLRIDWVMKKVTRTKHSSRALAALEDARSKALAVRDDSLAWGIAEHGRKLLRRIGPFSADPSRPEPKRSLSPQANDAIEIIQTTPIPLTRSELAARLDITAAAAASTIQQIERLGYRLNRNTKRICRVSGCMATPISFER